MDTLVDYLPLIIFGLFILRAVFKRPKPQQQVSNTQQVTRTAMRQQQAAPPPPSATSSATPFEDLVRRIEAAAAEASRKVDAPRPKAQKPQRQLTPRPAPPPTLRRDDSEFHQVERGGRPAEFHTAEPTPVDAEFHPSYDLTPDQQAYHESHRAARGPAPSAQMPSGAMPSRDMPGAHLHDPRSAQAAGKVHPIAATLRTPQGMRAAFIFKEVLSQRRGARRPLR